MNVLKKITTLEKERKEALHSVPKYISKELTDSARKDINTVLVSKGTSLHGLSGKDVEERLEQYGLNDTVKEKRLNWIQRLIKTSANPLMILLLVLALIALLTGDLKSAIMMFIMVLLSTILHFSQEWRADTAAQKLKAMVSTTSTVIREGKQEEIPLKYLVPGDIIRLSAGDIVPADVQIISAKDLFVNQATLTGEAIPVEKYPILNNNGDVKNPLELGNICFMGTNIETGSGIALVILTGSNTYFGNLSKSIVNRQTVTSFDRGISQVTWLMISFIAVLVPLVFIINGLGKGNWLEAFFFAMAVAVGLTPEMLPMIVTVNLSRGAISMSHKKVIVKKLSSIQNFGAMDVLCTDKTGTITEGRVILEKHLDVFGEDSQTVLNYSYLNSYYQTGLKNILDLAVLEHVELDKSLRAQENYEKVDEVPFDFVRRRMSVVVKNKKGRHILICKGAVEEVLSVCRKVRIKEKTISLNDSLLADTKKIVDDLSSDGFRVLALAYKVVQEENRTFTTNDENNLLLLGFLAFLDPPKLSALEAIKELNQSGIQVKILTGDNEIVTRRIAKQVGLPIDKALLGEELDQLSDEELSGVVEQTTIFAKLAPYHKEKIIKSLREKGHVVGFLGDGINDAPALKSADVGISVDKAVDIAKESSDIILLETSLLVLEQGVIEGRRVFGNIVKYIKMAASSNFGNMFSVVGGSLFLPFLPMLPIQIITNNILYDFSQTTIPTDSVDQEWTAKPRKWSINNMRRFILYIGPISSIFDYTTFLIMLFVFKCWNNPQLFHTGWFIESLVTQTMIIHVIRTNKIPFIQSRASKPLIATSILIVVIGIGLTFSPIAELLGFVSLPSLYWLLLTLMLLAYVILTQFVKNWFIKKFGDT